MDPATQLYICHTCEGRNGWGTARTLVEPGNDDERRGFLSLHQHFPKDD